MELDDDMELQDGNPFDMLLNAKIEAMRLYFRAIGYTDMEVIAAFDRDFLSMFHIRAF